MKADEKPIEHYAKPGEAIEYTSKCGEEIKCTDIDYINQLRVDRLMRGKKIAELKRYIEWLEWRVDGNTKQRDNMHQCERIAKALEARAKRIKEGMYD